jgi:hypothetical protein
VPSCTPVSKIQRFLLDAGGYIFMDGQSDDDYLFSARDRSSFELEIRTAGSEVEVKGILECFETTEEYFIENFPDLPDETDEPPTPE